MMMMKQPSAPSLTCPTTSSKRSSPFFRSETPPWQPPSRSSGVPSGLPSLSSISNRNALGNLDFSSTSCATLSDDAEIRGIWTKLRIRANLEYGDVLVSEWVDFAIERCVKELDLHDLDEKNKLHKNLLISHDVLTLKCLTSLNLENVRLYASSGINGPVSLPLLKNMSLKDVIFLDDREYTDVFAIPSLISGCPCIEHLSIHRCMLGYSTLHLDISSDSLKSLEIVHCHSMSVEVMAKNLESFTFYSDCTCPYHRTMYLLECDSLKHVHISCKGLKKLLVHDFQQSIENSFDTPHLESFEFGGYLKAKVNFAEAPVILVTCTIRVWETLWPIEYYSAMRDFLGSFDCSKKVKMHIAEAEGVLIPEHCRSEWSPPLPSIKQLQLYFPSLGERECCLRPSLIWMAPSAEILPFLIHEDDDEYDNFGDNDYNVVDDIFFFGQQ